MFLDVPGFSARNTVLTILSSLLFDLQVNPR